MMLPITALASAQQPLVSGMVITHSVRIAPGTYNLAAKDLIRTPVITVRGDNITVDMTGAVMRGTSQDTPPDQRTGLAILVDGGNNVTIKNANIHGYKLAVLGKGVTGLHLQNCNWSDNWKQHLKSDLAREDGADWMFFHHNENNEWIYGDPSYGAGGVYLTECHKFNVEGCQDTGSQCGLMLDKCDDGSVFENDFSFLSAIGLGLYRTTHVTAALNKLDWCVRGFSYGVYNRGQDSAGILLYEQSSHNKFIANSVTHGGDGFFLWAGQSTMDTGKGGCNDNVLLYNDFSHSPANGIEATFSTNTFEHNLMLECWHGVWGGYSYDTKIAHNFFGYNGESIAIEHGQNNSIADNTFLKENVALDIWGDGKPDPNWGYGKVRDTVSHDLTVTGNRFDDSQEALNIRSTKNVKIEGNRFVRNKAVFSGTPPEATFKNNEVFSSEQVELPGASANKLTVNATYAADPPTMATSGQPLQPFDFERENYLKRFDVGWMQRERPGLLAELRGLGVLTTFNDPFLAKNAIRGQRYILVDGWGPYDFQYPVLWPRGESQEDRGTVRHFEILGPQGSWRMVSSNGASWTSSKEGTVPGRLDFTVAPGKAVDLDIELEYRGEAVKTEFGKWLPAGTPYTFSYKQFFLPIDWHVKWYRWDQSDDPRDAQGWPKVLASPVIKEASTDKLDYAGNGGFAPGLPADHYATVAEGDFEVPAGSYILNLTTDDGARAWVDGKEVIKNAWHYQGPTPYSAKLDLSAGKHTIRVEHFQIDGYAALQVGLARG